MLTFPVPLRVHEDAQINAVLLVFFEFDIGVRHDFLDVDHVRVMHFIAFEELKDFLRALVEYFCYFLGRLLFNIRARLLREHSLVFGLECFILLKGDFAVSGLDSA